MHIIEKIKNNKKIFSNFSYLAILEIFVILAPLITYPYLVRVLGRELYGWVITGQITASYASILIDFGFRRVSAKYVAEARENIESLSRVVSTVLTLRFILWLITFVLYTAIVLLIPVYRQQWLLFIFSYGLTFASVLIPDFYFQGIEQMKYITVVNITTRLLFVCATFFVITSSDQYIYVPLLWSIGYMIGGVYSLYIVFKKHNVYFVMPSYQDYKFHMKVTTPIFLSDVMLNIKDKFNYNLMGGLLGMGDVVIYDIGTKIVNLLAKPTSIFCTVIFPRMSRNPDASTSKKIMLVLLCLSIIMVGIVYVFLPQIVKFFISEDIDLLALRIYLIVPVFTGLSFYIPSAVFVAFGRNKYVLYSTIFSTLSYVLLLILFWGLGWLKTVMSFVILTVISYVTETIYRIILSLKIFKEHNKLDRP